MSEEFDPYLKWLGIREAERPPNSYQLLGLEVFESDREVISNAADRQMAHVRTFQTGRHSAISQRVLNELAAARVTLLNAEKKRRYDEQLRAAEAPARQPQPLHSSETFAKPVTLIPDPIVEPPVFVEPAAEIEESSAPYVPTIVRRRAPKERRVDPVALTVSLVVAAAILAGVTVLVVADQMRRAPQKKPASPPVGTERPATGTQPQ